MLSCPRCQVVKCVRHRGDDVCCSVVFGTLVGVFSVMWLLLFATTRSVFKSVKVSVVEIAKRTN